MDDLTVDQRAAAAARIVKRRLFIWCEAFDLDTGDPDPLGLWDDVGVVEYLGRTYYGSGTVAKVSSVAARGDLTIPGITITLSGIAIETVDLVKARGVQQAPISVKIGIWNWQTQQLLPPLRRFFTGKVDDVKINTPEGGGASTIDFICESTSRMLTVSRTDTRSSASARLRHADDAIYDFSGAQRDKPLYFGRVAS